MHVRFEVLTCLWYSVLWCHGPVGAYQHLHLTHLKMEVILSSETLITTYKTMASQLRRLLNVSQYNASVFVLLCRYILICYWKTWHSQETYTQSDTTMFSQICISVVVLWVCLCTLIDVWRHDKVLAKLLIWLKVTFTYLLILTAWPSFSFILCMEHIYCCCKSFSHLLVTQCKVPSCLYLICTHFCVLLICQLLHALICVA